MSLIYPGVHIVGGTGIAAVLPVAVTGGLTTTQHIVSSSDISAGRDMTAARHAVVGSNLTVGSNLSGVTGTFSSNVTIAATLAGGALTVASGAILSGTLSVASQASFASGIGVTGPGTFASSLVSTGPVTFQSSLSVSGPGTFASNVVATGPVTMASSLTATGPVTFVSSLSVTGAATFSTNVAATGPFKLGTGTGLHGQMTYDPVTGLYTYVDHADVTQTFARVTDFTTFSYPIPPPFRVHATHASSLAHWFYGPEHGTSEIGTWVLYAGRGDTAYPLHELGTSDVSILRWQRRSSALSSMLWPYSYSDFRSNIATLPLQAGTMSTCLRNGNFTAEFVARPLERLAVQGSILAISDLVNAVTLNVNPASGQNIFQIWNMASLTPAQSMPYTYDWAHYAMTVSSAANLIRVFVNGVLRGTATMSFNQISTSGFLSPGGFESWAGEMASLHISSGILSDAQIGSDAVRCIPALGGV